VQAEQRCAPLGMMLRHSGHARVFDSAGAVLGPIEIVLYNAGARVRGTIAELDPGKVEQAVAANAFGGFLVAQQAARQMLPRGFGAILFTGATASVKGFAHSAAFAMGKFALRGLAQSAARELGPKGIHVAHVVIDGAIDGAFIRGLMPDAAEKLACEAILVPDEIAKNYVWLYRQKRSAWTFEMDLRPWSETW